LLCHYCFRHVLPARFPKIVLCCERSAGRDIARTD
jgi:hypothetical protein